MMRTSTLLAPVLLGLALLGGCKGKDGDPGPAGPAGPAGPVGPSLTGSMVGFLEVYDEFNNSQSKSGVTVTLENVTPAVTATTDANGRYELANVKNGTYNIAFSKAGYGISKIQGYPHAGGDQPTFLYTQGLTGISTTNVTSATEIPTGSSYALIRAFLSNNSAMRPPFSGLSAIAFIGTTAAVNSTTGIPINPSNGGSGPSPYVEFYMDRAYLNQRGFASNTTAYAIIYGAPFSYYDGGYTDLQTGRRVYTSINPNGPRVVMFRVP